MWSVLRHRGIDDPLEGSLLQDQVQASGSGRGGAGEGQGRGRGGQGRGSNGEVHHHLTKVSRQWLLVSTDILHGSVV